MVVDALSESERLNGRSSCHFEASGRVHSLQDACVRDIAIEASLRCIRASLSRSQKTLWLLSISRSLILSCHNHLDSLDQDAFSQSSLSSLTVSI